MCAYAVASQLRRWFTGARHIKFNQKTGAACNEKGMQRLFQRCHRMENCAIMWMRKTSDAKGGIQKYKVGTGYDIRIIRSDQDDYEFGVFSDRDLFCTYVSKVKTKAMAMYLHVAFGIFILDHSRCIPGCLLFKPFGVSEYDA